MAPSWTGPSKTLNIRKKKRKWAAHLQKKKVTKGIAPVYKAKIKKEGKIHLGVARDPEKSSDEYIRSKRKTKQSVCCAP